MLKPIKKNDKVFIAWTLATNDRAVESALVALYRRQSEFERGFNKTVDKNNQGFRANHARTGPILARRVLNGTHLEGESLLMAREIVNQYLRQLSEIATEKLMQDEQTKKDEAAAAELF